MTDERDAGEDTPPPIDTEDENTDAPAEDDGLGVTEPEVVIDYVDEEEPA